MAVSRIGQIENASPPGVTLGNARDLDAAFDTDGILERLMIMVENPPDVPDWLAQFIDREARAVALSEYASQIVPGLLQTPAYARAVLATGLILDPSASVEAKLATRMARAEDIFGRLAPPALWFVVEESLLRRPVGGPLVMAEQLGHLAEMADGKVGLQVIPESVGAHPALGGALTILALPDGPSVAYLEGSSIGQLFDDPYVVARYGLVYDHLQSHALTPAESLSLIRLAQEDMIKMSQIHPQRDDFANAEWKKSSRSNNQGQCVEVALAVAGVVPVRDSKDLSRQPLTASPAAWSAFVASL